MATHQLIHLKQIGIIWEYVKKFLALMFYIQDMSKNDKMFFFLEGFKP